MMTWWSLLGLSSTGAYEVVYGDGKGDQYTLVEVSTDSNRLIGYELRDHAGDLIGRLKGRIDINLLRTSERTGPLKADTLIHADFYSSIVRDGQQQVVGEKVIPVGLVGEFTVGGLAERLRRIALVDSVVDPKLSPISRPRQTRSSPGAMTVVRRDNRERYTDQSRVPTADNPDSVLLIRDYGQGNFERYEDPRFDPIMARWLPGRVLVYVKGSLRETRTLVSVDAQGLTAYRIETYGQTTAFWARLLPPALRSFVPDAMAIRPGVSSIRLDTRTEDGLLASRDLIGPGAIDERTDTTSNGSGTYSP